MATKKSTAWLAAKLPLGMKPDELMHLAGAEDEMVSIPFLQQPYAKAPRIDPYLKEESITREPVKFGDVELPPILSGIQSGLDLHGAPRDYHVRIMWASRRQIDQALKEVERCHPDTRTVMAVVRSFMCHIDSIRDSALHVNMSAQRAMQAGQTDKAAAELASLREVFGRWDDENRLPLH